MSWLLQHAELGELPDGLDPECRAWASSFLTAALHLIPSERDPKRLAEITPGILEGEFDGAH